MRKEGPNRPHRPAGRQPVAPDQALDVPAPAASIQRVLAAPAGPSPHDLRTLQRTIGNRAVQRLLAARAPRSSPVAARSIQRVKIPFFSETAEQLDTDEPLDIQNYAVRMVTARKDTVVKSIIQHLEGIREKPNVENLIVGLKSMLIMAKYNRESMPDTRLTDTAKKLAEYQKEDYISIDGLMKVYKELGEKIFSMAIEELATLVAKRSHKVFDTNTVSDYLQKEKGNSIKQKLLSTRVQQVSMEEFDQLKEGLREVGAFEWDTGQATKGGIFTEEMAPCITLGLTAYSSTGQLYSALHHSFNPEAKATVMIETLQQAFGQNELPAFDRLKNIKYFAVGGNWESIDKASDILTQLREIGADVSGITFTTSLEEEDLVKAVIVTAKGAIKYAVFKRSEFQKPSSQKETFDSGGLGFSSAKTLGEPKGGFGGFSSAKTLGEPKGGFGGFSSAKMLGEPKGGFGGFSSAKTLGEPKGGFGGFSSAKTLGEPKGGFGGFSSAKTLGEPKEQSTSPVESFTSAKTLGEQQNKNDDDF